MNRKKYRKGIVQPYERIEQRDLKLDIANTKNEIRTRIAFLKIQGISNEEILKDIETFLA